MSVPTYSAVYYVLESEQGGINPLAIRPQIKNQGKVIEWEDTGHGFWSKLTTSPSTRDEMISYCPTEIIVPISDTHQLKLVYLTKEIFDKHISKNAAMQPKFETTQELQNYYLNTNFYGY
jgi:hypothetical protein